MNDKVRVLRSIGECAVLEQLAEECSELSKAALKLARIKRGENPTPVKSEDAVKNLTEEVADVQNCISVVSLKYPVKYHDLLPVMDAKMQRWARRLEER